MLHRLLSISAVLIALLISASAFAQLDCMGVNGGTALPGTPCDDGNPFTYDTWNDDCECIGLCLSNNVGGENGVPGGPCDENIFLINAVWSDQCICEGDWIDCNGVNNGPDVQGTPCDDGDPLTNNDTWNWFCQCVGEMDELDCLGIVNGPAMPGTACDDGNVLTINDLWNSDCECEAWLNTVSGRVFLDVNENGVYDAPDHMVHNKLVQFGPMQLFASSGTTGQYNKLLSEGSYSLTTYPVMNYVQATPFPELELLGGGQEYLDNDIRMVPLQLLTDMSAGLNSWLSVPRPGFTNLVVMSAHNEGTMPVGGSLVFTFDPIQYYQNSYPPGGVLAGNTVTWNLAELGLNQSEAYYVTMETPVNVPLGTDITYSVLVVSSLADDVPANNQSTITATVVGAYDPNDKHVSPSTLTPYEVIDGKPVEYTIRFQNTGTYLAETVRIEDQLSEDLNLSSFEFLGSSHPCTWSIDNGMLEFYFEEIMLPDSNANEPESHGFVMFRITPTNDLQLGETVENSAAIYFDFNEPIITDPAVFTVENSTGISDQETEEIKLWPNPSTGILQVEFTGSATGDLVVLDQLGRPVHQQRISIGTTSMDLSDLASGNYIVRIDSPERSYRSRFVKK